MKKKLITIVAVFSFLLAVLIGFMRWQLGQNPPAPEEEYVSSAASSAEAPAPEPVVTNPELDIPIDFAALQETNPDIYAWITIPNTVIDYPICQRKDDDLFYLTHSSELEEFRAGAIYSEHYNSLDFSDPLTLVYGHNMKNGSMFAGLHQFEDMDFFQNNQEFTVYTPNSILHYTIFAARLTDDSHLLIRMNYGKTPQDRRRLLEEIFSDRSMDAFVNEDAPVDENSRILALSTCHRAGPDRRYVVFAYLSEEIR